MRHAMPEATVLYSVTAVVVAGLVVWVAVVRKTAKEPWARERLSRDAEAPSPAVVTTDAGGLDADSTARATPLALAAETKPEDAKADAKDADA